MDTDAKNVPERERRVTSAGTSIKPAGFGADAGWRIGGFVLLVLLACLAFHQPLRDMVRYAMKEDLYSHVFLVPVASLYLVWLQRQERQTKLRTSKLPAAAAFGAAVIAIVTYWLAGTNGWKPSNNDYLSITMFAFVSTIVGLLLLCFGHEKTGQHAFAVGFLLFMVPIPDAVTHAITIFFQYTSAHVSHLLLRLTATPVFRSTALIFELPGITIEVAEECSGIRATVVLFILSLVAGHVLLKNPWHRAALVAVVIPLGILRNALRIVTISLLCVHVHPDMIHSAIHRRGGSLFFLISLVPFFFLLWWLRKREVKNK